MRVNKLCWLQEGEAPGCKSENLLVLLRVGYNLLVHFSGVGPFLQLWEAQLDSETRRAGTEFLPLQEVVEEGGVDEVKRLTEKLLQHRIENGMPLQQHIAVRQNRSETFEIIFGRRLFATKKRSYVNILHMLGVVPSVFHYTGAELQDPSNHNVI